MTQSSEVPTGRLAIAIASVGFGAVATAQVTNMILARANEGYIPAFALAFFRWAIVALGLLPLCFAELHTLQQTVRCRWWQILITGFLGMFVWRPDLYCRRHHHRDQYRSHYGHVSDRGVSRVLVHGPETIARLQCLGIGSLKGSVNGSVNNS
jgi:hypothetical protein